MHCRRQLCRTGSWIRRTRSKKEKDARNSIASTQVTGSEPNQQCHNYFLIFVCLTPTQACPVQAVASKPFVRNSSDLMPCHAIPSHPNPIPLPLPPSPLQKPSLRILPGTRSIRAELDDRCSRHVAQSGQPILPSCFQLDTVLYSA